MISLKPAALLLAAACAATPAAAQTSVADDVLTLAEAARLLRVPPKIVVKLAQTGSIPARQVGSQWRFNRVALMEWLQGERYAYPAGALQARGKAPASGGAPAPALPAERPPVQEAGEGERALTAGELAVLSGRGEAGSSPLHRAQAPAPEAPASPPAAPTAPAASPEPAKPIGEGPSGLTAEEVALRDQGVLLKRGATTVEFGLAYSRQTRENLPILRVEQNTTTATLAARYGIRDDFQVSARLPGIYQRTATFAAETLGSGISRKDTDHYAGDIALSLQGVAQRERVGKPNLTWSIDTVLPTGPGDTGLGAGLILSKTYDPVVIYGALNYMYGFDADRSESRRVLAKNNWSFNLGYAYAINDSLALSGAFVGFYRTPSDGADAIPLERESYLLQLGMTWQLTPKLFIEPAVAFGVGGTAPDMNFSLNLPYTF